MHKRCLHLFACFFICASLYAQLTEFRGQYPFVYYTPKDGLVNSRVKKIFQDSKDRMYFITYGGLSVYDGTRFMNYSQADGLANDLVNDVAELTPDSLLVATNTSRLNTLVHGKIGIYKTDDNFYPVINRFFKSSDGDWYVAADDGLFKLVGHRFIRLPFLNEQGERIDNIDKIIEWKNFFLIIPWSAGQEKLILYDKQQQKVKDIYTQEGILCIANHTKEELWITTTEGVKRIDLIALQQGRLNILPLSPEYAGASGWRNAYIFSDRNGNTWLYNNDKVMKISPDGKQELFGSEQDLKTSNLSDIFIDREGTTWLASDGNGIIKMTGTGIQLLNNFFPGHTSAFTAIHQQADTTWLFNTVENAVYRITPNGLRSFTLGEEKIKASTIFIQKERLYLTYAKNMLCIRNKDQAFAYQHPTAVFADYSKDLFEVGTGIVDRNGAIIQFFRRNDTSFYLSVLYENRITMQQKISYAGDQIALDDKGRLWIATRDNHLMVFSLHPEQPSRYLQLLQDYSKEIAGINPRSITVDKTGRIWIGTRYKGLYCLTFDDMQFRSARQFTTRQGLTDNFIYWLHCDENNTIWAGTQTGLDKIFPGNGQYIIENVTKSKNIFQTIHRVITAGDKSVWALASDGNIIKVSAISAPPLVSPPPLLLTSLIVNDEEASDSIHDFSYHQNNFSFSVAAPSFINERSIRYSYLLKGSSKKNWSEPTTNAAFAFINLAPGEYELMVKADFPALIYPPQTLHYPFIIAPPYWQTWWFRVLAATIVLALIYYMVRAYYLRVIDKKQMQFEQQQALEKERTRIATDMHDDLGAGLSKIRFLSETVQRNITEQAHQPHLQNIVSSSVELVDKFNEIIWAMNEKNNSLEDLLYYIRSYTAKYAEETGLYYRIHIPEMIPSISISGEMRRHIFLTAKESLHNIVKHAEAKNIRLLVQLDDAIIITIQDDGKGFPMNEMKNSGNGLRSMEQRIKNVNGTLVIESKAGTTLKITIPFPVPEKDPGT
jgi:signal transduction histidine kinase/ligand-binding sensor domain-containing protein